MRVSGLYIYNRKKSILLLACIGDGIDIQLVVQCRHHKSLCEKDIKQDGHSLIEQYDHEIDNIKGKNFARC